MRDRLSARYFFALEPGQTVNDIAVSVTRSDCLEPAARVVAWRDRLAYIEVDCGGTPIFPGGGDASTGERFRKRTELRVNAVAWDPTNDPSFETPLVTEAEEGHKTDRVVVFEQGRRLFGRVP